MVSVLFQTQSCGQQFPRFVLVSVMQGSCTVLEDFQFKFHRPSPLWDLQHHHFIPINTFYHRKPGQPSLSVQSDFTKKQSPRPDQNNPLKSVSICEKWGPFQVFTFPLKGTFLKKMISTTVLDFIQTLNHKTQYQVGAKRKQPSYLIANPVLNQFRLQQ